jgi:KUP system potassium uptake protein
VDSAHGPRRRLPRGWPLALGILGASLFYGDGIITPAISVLSAIEGISVAAPAVEAYIVPATVVVLVGLFVVQSHGTGRVGAIFGPIMLVWFLVLGAAGIAQVAQNPRILLALDPRHAVAMFAAAPGLTFAALGAVVLAVTGGEALYADMGHFGRRPIRLAWVGLVLPALLLNYFGQGALLLADPSALDNPFYRLIPEWGRLPMVGLATAATVIASQAVISGAFSLTRTAIQLDLLPRMSIRHTSAHEIGQIYVPRINWLLLLGVMVLVLGLRSSSALANAYGIAVTGTMAATTALAYLVARRIWHWSRLTAGTIAGGFLIVDLAFFGANALKFLDGGWMPLLVGTAITLAIWSWLRGRRVVAAQEAADGLPVEQFIQRLVSKPVVRVPGTAVFMNRDPATVPRALLHNLKHNKVIHERVVLLTVVNEEIPHVPRARRISTEALGGGIQRVVLRFGFMESPDVPGTLERAGRPDLSGSDLATSFYLGHDTLVRSSRPALPAWQERLFLLLAASAASATSFFRIPPNRVMELGTQIEV